MNCDIFSLGAIKRVDGRNDEFLDKLKKPNKFQTQRQFLWSFRFWQMVSGTAYLYPTSKVLGTDRGQLYWLNTAKMEWDTDVLKKLDRIVLSEKELNSIKRSIIKYQYLDGTVAKFMLGDLIPFIDLSNNINNWYGGNSRLDALYKVIANVEGGLDAKNINLEFSRKYIASGTFDPTKELSGFKHMQDVEKEDIERKLRGNRSVLPVKSEVNIERFVSDLANLALDDSYEADLMKVGSMYNIPKELLDAVKTGATYENQEKALARHISYSEIPKAMDMLEGLCKHFGVNPDDYYMTWEDQPYMQVFEKDKADVKMRKLNAMARAVSLGADVNEVAEYFGIDLEFTPPEPNDENNGNGNTETN